MFWKNVRAIPGGQFLGMRRIIETYERHDMADIAEICPIRQTEVIIERQRRRFPPGFKVSPADFSHPHGLIPDHFSSVPLSK